MSLAFILVLIAAFSLGVQRFFGRVGMGSFVTSVVYLLVGAGLGGFGIGILPGESIHALQPVASLMMGVIGFILGLPLSHAVRHTTFSSTGLVASLGVGGVVGLASFGGLRWLVAPALGIAYLDQIWLAIALGAAGTAVATPLVYLTVRRIGARGPVSESLFAWAMMSNIVAVVAAGGALAAARTLKSGGGAELTRTEWLVACGAIGVACGILYTLFLGRGAERSKDRVFLATVGIVVFTSGLAAAMGVSPMLLNLIAGLTTSLLYRETDALYQVLQSLYEPACTMLAILAGAMWVPAAPIGWALAAVYLTARLLSTTLFGAVATRISDPKLSASRFGTGIWGQGALAIAVVVNFAQVNPALASLALTAVFPALLISDFMSPFTVRTMLLDAGETATPPKVADSASALEKREPT